MEDLYRATYNHLKVIALVYAEDKNDWEDILQETYLRVDKYIKNVNPEKDGYNWLCKIVQNVAYGYYKNKKPTEAWTYFTFDMLEDSIIEKDALLAEIAKLPQDDQRLLYLRFWEDKSFREIASEINISKSVVQKRVTALMKKLLANLQ